MRRNALRSAGQRDARRAAEVLRASRARIIRRYVSRLHPAGAEPGTPDTAEAMATGDRAVADVIRLIENGSAEPAASPGAATSDSELFEAALFELAHSTEVSAGPLAPIVLAATALHRRLVDRVAERMAEDANHHRDRLIDAVQRTRVRERGQITRDLHDRVGSWLMVAYHQLEMNTFEQLDGTPSTSDRIGLAAHAVKEAMRALRMATAELRTRPTASLADALRTALGALDRPGVAISLDLHGDDAWATDEIKDEAFLIVREAVHNAVVHGHPTQVDVVVSITPDELRADISDDGKGFEPGGVQRAGGSAGIGLSSMRERARLLKGSLHVSSTPGDGTRVRLHLPLDSAGDRAA